MWSTSPSHLKLFVFVAKKNKCINKNNKNQPTFMSKQELSFTLPSPVP